MKNAYGTVPRATGEAHLELWGVKILQVCPHPVNILSKPGSNFLNSTIEQQLSNPS